MPSPSPAFDIAPDAFLGLAGHPLRWKLLRALSDSDLTVQDLTARVGEAQNLVSYHLSRLRQGGIVTARRSSADRRDSYYGMDLARVGRMLSATGGALHPGLRLASPPRRTMKGPPARVLFLCTGNSARSPMAAALAEARSGGGVAAFSAGSDPRPVHPNAVRVLRDDHGLDISAHRPRRLDDLAGETFDQVITLCDRVKEVCPGFPGHPQTPHWSLANPAADAPDEVTYPAFRQTATDLVVRIDFLIAALSERETTPEHQGEPHV